MEFFPRKDTVNVLKDIFTHVPHVLSKNTISESVGECEVREKDEKESGENKFKKAMKRHF